MQKQQITQQLLTVIRYLASYLLGYMIAVAVGKIPSEGRLPLITANPLVLVVLFITAIMIWRLFPSFRNSRSTSLATIMMGCTYTVIIYLLALDMPEAVVFNTEMISYLTLPVYTVAVLPFLMKQPIISFKQDKAERDSIFFAASIMWLSPFFAEMLIMLKWYILSNLENRLSYMVLGGKGTNDVLFFYGFWMFTSVELFHLLSRLKDITKALWHRTQSMQTITKS